MNGTRKKQIVLAIPGSISWQTVKVINQCPGSHENNLAYLITLILIILPMQWECNLNVVRNK
jgi:hypothetical protein